MDVGLQSRIECYSRKMLVSSPRNKTCAYDSPCQGLRGYCLSEKKRSKPHDSWSLAAIARSCLFQSFFMQDGVLVKVRLKNRRETYLTREMRSIPDNSQPCRIDREYTFTYKLSAPRNALLTTLALNWFSLLIRIEALLINGDNHPRRVKTTRYKEQSLGYYVPLYRKYSRKIEFNFWLGSAQALARWVADLVKDNRVSQDPFLSLLCTAGWGLRRSNQSLRLARPPSSVQGWLSSKRKPWELEKPYTFSKGIFIFAHVPVPFDE